MLSTVSNVHVSSDPDYADFEQLIAARVASAKGPLFSTNAEELFESYLGGIPEQERQHYNCRCCRRFIERFGGLVTIGADGISRSLLWDADSPGSFHNPVAAMLVKVQRAKVTGVFVNGEPTWGTAFNVPGAPSKYEGQRWTHLHGTPPVVFKSPLVTAEHASAEKLQDYIILHKALAEIPMEAVVQAVRVLEADAVDRSEKTLGVAKWLLALHQSIADLRGPKRNNLIWLAVATAPPGWCHVRSTMISTLLDDVIEGLPFDAIQRRWNAKMHPLQYQRPTAPPSDGNIVQANKIMEKLKSEGALARRFAQLDDVVALWKPREVPPDEANRGGGAFDHLKTKRNAIKPVELPATKIVWEKFRDTVLPDALEIEVHLSGGSQPFYGLVTAVNPDSPPMLQWDGLEGQPRNQVSWYFWHGGTTASHWGLSAGWNKVGAVCLKPCHWQSDKFTHQGPGVFFVLPDARESRMAGGGYFPETLRSEYHGIRSVIEAHSRNATLEGMADGNANGIALDDGSSLTVRVRMAGGLSSYQLTL